jgi:hypothetical protein
MDAKLKAALDTVEEAEKAGRALTPDERTEIEGALAEAKARKQDDDLKAAVRELDQPAKSGAAGRGPYGAFLAAGWQAGTKVAIPAEEFYAKTASFSGDVDDLSPTREEGPALGQDTRYLFRAIPASPIAGTVTSIQILQQQSRTLASVSEVRRPLLSTATKAESGSVRGLIEVTPEMLAAIESEVPNAIMRSEGFESMVNQDLQMTYNAALDDLVAEQLYADAETSPAGADIYASVRAAITALQGDGYAPNALGLSPADAEAMDLFRDGGTAEQYLHPGEPADNPFGLQRFISNSITDPLVFDRAAAAKIWLGPVSLASFEENAGQTNTSTVRFEGIAAAAVQRAPAIVAITG